MRGGGRPKTTATPLTSILIFSSGWGFHRHRHFRISPLQRTSFRDVILTAIKTSVLFPGTPFNSTTATVAEVGNFTLVVVALPAISLAPLFEGNFRLKTPKLRVGRTPVRQDPDSNLVALFTLGFTPFFTALVARLVITVAPLVATAIAVAAEHVNPLVLRVWSTSLPTNTTSFQCRFYSGQNG